LSISPAMAPAAAAIESPSFSPAAPLNSFRPAAWISLLSLPASVLNFTPALKVMPTLSLAVTPLLSFLSR
jgi:hypothetical protein